MTPLGGRIRDLVLVLVVVLGVVAVGVVAGVVVVVAVLLLLLRRNCHSQFLQTGQVMVHQRRRQLRGRF